MADKRIIKKYPNRRLYDTEISSYITIEDVRQLVVDGEPFEVHDAKTNEDITRSVLLQIIAEHEERGQPMFSTHLLSQIIRFYGDSLQGFMGSYLERSLETFMEQSQQFRAQLNDLMGKTPWGVFNELTERNLEIWKNMQSRFLNPSGGAGKPAPGPAPGKPPGGKEGKR
jgi:polyhydroxyalkanoate synthesis repressor PhaR